MSVDKETSGLAAAGALTGTELVHVVQGGNSRRTTSQAIANLKDTSSYMTIAAVAAGYQPLDSDLTTFAALTPSNDDVVQRKAGAWSNRTMAQLAVDLKAAASFGLSAGTQTDEETGTSTTVATTPGTQQFHPSAAKCWAYVTVSAGTPSVAASYNITSITDTGIGDLTITIATDFSSAAWACIFGASGGSTTRAVVWQAQAAGSAEARWYNMPDGNLNADPSVWHFAGFGDQ